MVFTAISGAPRGFAADAVLAITPAYHDH